MPKTKVTLYMTSVKTYIFLFWFKDVPNHQQRIWELEEVSGWDLQGNTVEGLFGVCVCSYISASGVDNIFQIDGIANAEKYRQDLAHHVITSGKCLTGNNLNFKEKCFFSCYLKLLIYYSFYLPQSSSVEVLLNIGLNNCQHKYPIYAIHSWKNIYCAFNCVFDIQVHSSQGMVSNISYCTTFRILYGCQSDIFFHSSVSFL